METILTSAGGRDLSVENRFHSPSVCAVLLSVYACFRHRIRLPGKLTLVYILPYIKDNFYNIDNFFHASVRITRTTLFHASVRITRTTLF